MDSRREMPGEATLGGATPPAAFSSAGELRVMSPEAPGAKGWGCPPPKKKHNTCPSGKVGEGQHGR